MDDHVGVTSDRGREVRVDRGGQTIVRKVARGLRVAGAEVARLREASARETRQVTKKAARDAGAGMAGMAGMPRLLHAARRHDADELVGHLVPRHLDLVERRSQLPVAPALQAEAQRLHHLAERLKVGGRRRRVPTQHRTIWVGLMDAARHGHVGQQHHLFHHAVGRLVFVHGHVDGVVCLGVQLKPHLCNHVRISP